MSTDFVYWEPVAGSVTTDNILLLPKMVAAGPTEPNGAILTVLNADDTYISLNEGLIVAGNPVAYQNIRRTYTQGDYLGKTVNAVHFASDGVLTLAAQSGDARTDVTAFDDPDAFSDAAINITQTATYSITGGSNPTYVASGNYESALFLSDSGTFAIDSDLNGNMTETHSVNLQGYTVSGNLTDNCSGNTSTNAFVRAKTIDLYNNFLGTVTVTGSFTAIGKKAATVNNNTVTVQALWAESGNFSCDGVFGLDDTATITVTASNIKLIADYAQASDSTKVKYSKCLTQAQYDALSGDDQAKYTWKQVTTVSSVTDYYWVESASSAITEAEYNALPGEQRAQNEWFLTSETNASASATGNIIGAYGVRADNGTITIKRDFSAAVNASLEDVTVTARAHGEGTSQATAVFDITAGAYGFYSKDFVLDGSYLGSITAKADNFNLTASGSHLTQPVSKDNIKIASIYAEDNISVSDWLSGTLTSQWNTSTITWDYKLEYTHEVYGIYAGKTLSVGDGRGFFDSAINAEQSAANTVATVRTYGIKAEKLYAESLGATINVVANAVSAGIGVSVSDFENNRTAIPNVKESSFDIIGDITVTGGLRNIGIEGNKGLNLRIASNINAAGIYGYAILSGEVMKDLTVAVKNYEDNIEVAAGASVNGIIELAGGTNYVTINSNARVNGNIRFTAGTLNLTFVLDRYGLLDGTTNPSDDGDYIFTGALTAAVGTTVLIDLNAAEYGDYYLMSNTDIATASLVYQGKTKSISFTGSAVDIGNMTVTGFKNGNKRYITVAEKKSRTLDDFAAASVLIEETGAKTVQCTISNDQDRDMSLYKDYVLWLTYTAKSGKKVSISKSGLPASGIVDFTLADEISEITDLNAVLSKNGTKPDDRDSWKQTLAVMGKTDAETGKFKLTWTLNSAKSVTSGYRYDVEYRISKDGGATWTNSTLVTMDYLASYYEIEDMKEGYQIQTRVRLEDASSSKNYAIGEWTSTGEYEFDPKEAAVVPAASGLIDWISTGITANAVRRLEWNDMRARMVNGLDHYEIEYFWAKDESGNAISDLTDAELEKAWNGEEFTHNEEHVNVTVYSRAVSANSYILSDLDVNAAYYWRVRAVSLNDEEGDWSNTAQFTIVTGDTAAPTENPSGKSIEIDPKFDYKEKTMTLSWSGYLAIDETTSSENISYLVYYKAASESAYSVYQPTKTISGTKTTYTVSVSGYEMNQDFDYYITARDEAGRQSAKLREKTLKGDQAAPTGGAIAGTGSYAPNPSGGTDFIVSFTITAAADTDDGGVDSPSGVATTELQYQKNSTWITVKEWNGTDVATSYTAPGIDTRDIPSNSDFECPTYWRLVATDHAGNVYTSATETVVAVQPGVITLDPASLKWTLDSSTVTDFSITCSWAEAASTPYALSSYTVYAKETGSDDWFELGTTKYGTTSLTVTSNVLDGDSVYEWKVVATDAKGFSAEANASKDIETPHIENTYKFKTFTVTPEYSGSTMNVTVSWTGNDPSLSDDKTYVIQKSDIGLSNFEDYITVKSSDKSISKTFTINDSYQYRVYTISKGEKVYSTVSSALLDTTPPAFGGSSATHSGYKFTWSAATDSAGSEGEGVSGMKEYKLYFDTKSSRSSSAKEILTGSTATSYTLTKAVMKANGITSGNYYWWVAAMDNAGNESVVLTGDSSIDVDIEGPTKTTLTTMNIPTITVTYKYVNEDVTGPYDSVDVRDPSSITVKFDVSQNTYTDKNGKYDDNGKYNYFIYEIASDRNFSNLVYSTERDSYDYINSGTYEANTLTLSTGNNGIARLAGYKKGQEFYWRIRAVDTLGNYSDYYETGTPFKLVDPEIEYDDGTFAPIEDLFTNPTIPTGLTVDKYNGDDQTKKALNTYTFRWTHSQDAFGIRAYEIQCTNKSTKEVTYQYVDASLISSSYRKTAAEFGGFTAGDYQFKIRAYDGSGRKSDWGDPVYVSINSSARSSEAEDGLTSDTAITLNNQSGTAAKSYQVHYTLPSNYLGTSANYNEIWYKLGGAATGVNRISTNGMLNLRFSNVNSKLKITLYSRSKGKMKSFSVGKADGGISNFIYNWAQYSDLMYIHVQNTNKKTYDVTFNMDADLEYFPTNDLGPNSFYEAEASGGKYLGTAGTATISEWVGMNDAADYWMMVGGAKGSEPNTGLLSGITVTGVQAKLKLSLYIKENDGSFRKLAAKNISKDATLFANKMVDRYYFVVVESGDNGAGKQNSKYTLTVNETYYPNNHDSQYNPTYISLGTTVSNEWVGYGDAQNHYKFTVTESDGDGVFSVDLTTYSAKVTASLYNVAADGSIKLISKQVKVKGGKTNIFAKSTPVLEAGKSYMVIVDAGNVTKPSQNTYFDLKVTETETFKYKQADNQNNSFADARELTALGVPVSGWVGFNDAENYYKFTYKEDSVGPIRPVVSKGKGIASMFYDSSYNQIKEKQMVVGENYYLKVYAKDEKKYYSNDFTVTMNYK